MSKPELLFAVLGMIGVPVSTGVWVGSLQGRVSRGEERITQVEAAPANIAVLDTRVGSLTDEVVRLRDDIKVLSSKQDQIIGKLDALK